MCTPEVNGSFLVRLNVSDQLGVYAESNLILTIDPPLTVGVPTPYVLADQEAPAVLAVIPSGGSPPYTIRWNFGDGTTGTGAPVSHSYVRVGAFAARATVTDLGGGNVSAPINVNVSLPMNDLAVRDNRTEVDVGIPIQFGVSVSDGSPPYRVAWTFGDGNSANNSTSVHAFAIAGIFDVSATVTDAANQSQTASTTITVNPLPTITLRTPGGTTLIAGTAGAFSALVTDGTAPLQVVWRFGDGTSASGQSVNHTYANAGSYAASVTVTDSGGGTVRVNFTVDVSSPPVLSTNSVLELGAGIAVGLVAGMAVGWILRTRRSRGMGGSPDGDSAASSIGVEPTGANVGDSGTAGYDTYGEGEPRR